MARGDYAPEIKKALGTGKPGRVNLSPKKDSPAEVANDRAKGISQNDPGEAEMDARAQSQPRRPPQIPTGPKNPQPPQTPGNVPQTPHAPPDMHHVAAATSIAHAILNRSSGGM
jgi:hypothetical protein